VYLIYCKNCLGNWSGGLLPAGFFRRASSGGLLPAGFFQRASSGGLCPAGDLWLSTKIWTPQNELKTGNETKKK
jgi:hypothetical protein